MLTSDGKIPRFIRLFFVKCKPPRHDLILLVRERSCQKLSINRYCCFIFPIVDVNMWFIVLSYIMKQHVDYHSSKTTPLWQG